MNPCTKYELYMALHSCYKTGQTEGRMGRQTDNNNCTMSTKKISQMHFGVTLFFLQMYIKFGMWHSFRNEC